MVSESPVIMVDLPFCYLNFDHRVRKQIRKAEYAENKRQECLAAYKEARTGKSKLVFLDDYLRFEDLERAEGVLMTFNPATN